MGHHAQGSRSRQGCFGRAGSPRNPGRLAGSGARRVAVAAGEPPSRGIVRGLQRAACEGGRDGRQLTAAPEAWGGRRRVWAVMRSGVRARGLLRMSGNGTAPTDGVAHRRDGRPGRPILPGPGLPKAAVARGSRRAGAGGSLRPGGSEGREKEKNKQKTRTHKCPYFFTTLGNDKRKDEKMGVHCLKFVECRA